MEDDWPDEYCEEEGKIDSLDPSPANDTTKRIPQNDPPPSSTSPPPSLLSKDKGLDPFSSSLSALGASHLGGTKADGPSIFSVIEEDDTETDSDDAQLIISDGTFPRPPSFPSPPSSSSPLSKQKASAMHLKQRSFEDQRKRLQPPHQQNVKAKRTNDGKGAVPLRGENPKNNNPSSCLMNNSNKKKAKKTTKGTTITTTRKAAPTTKSKPTSSTPLHEATRTKKQPTTTKASDHPNHPSNNYYAPEPVLASSSSSPVEVEGTRSKRTKKLPKKFLNGHIIMHDTSLKKKIKTSAPSPEKKKKKTAKTKTNKKPGEVHGEITVTSFSPLTSSPSPSSSLPPPPSAPVPAPVIVTLPVLPPPDDALDPVTGEIPFYSLIWAKFGKRFFPAQLIPRPEGSNRKQYQVYFLTDDKFGWVQHLKYPFKKHLAEMKENNRGIRGYLRGVERALRLLEGKEEEKVPVKKRKQAGGGEKQGVKRKRIEQTEGKKEGEYESNGQDGDAKMEEEEEEEEDEEEEEEEDSSQVSVTRLTLTFQGERILDYSPSKDSPPSNSSPPLLSPSKKARIPFPPPVCGEV